MREVKLPVRVRDFCSSYRRKSRTKGHAIRKSPWYAIRIELSSRQLVQLRIQPILIPASVIPRSAGIVGHPIVAPPCGVNLTRSEFPKSWKQHYSLYNIRLTAVRSGASVEETQIGSVKVATHEMRVSSISARQRSNHYPHNRRLPTHRAVPGRCRFRRPGYLLRLHQPQQHSNSWMPRLWAKLAILRTGSNSKPESGGTISGSKMPAPIHRSANKRCLDLTCLDRTP